MVTVIASGSTASIFLIFCICCKLVTRRLKRGKHVQTSVPAVEMMNIANISSIYSQAGQQEGMKQQNIVLQQEGVSADEQESDTEELYVNNAIKTQSPGDV